MSHPMTFFTPPLRSPVNNATGTPTFTMDVIR
jgi:hypothetical protein